MNNRIAIFLPSLDGGGAEKIMLALAEKFVSRGVDCDIVIAITKGQFLTSVPKGVRLIKLGKHKPISATFALAHYLRHERPSVLLSTVFNANIAALLAAVVSFTRIRVVTCEASPIDWDVKGQTWWDTLANKVSARVLYGRANASIAVSAGVRLALLHRRLMRPENVHVIPNPVPSLHFPHEGRRYTMEKPLVLACGRLEFQKDHATLLRGFALLRRQFDARLMILGEGSLQGALEELANELGIEKDVVFAGFDPDPCRVMRTASIFVHTARYEGFGVVLLEALASGCPVVATDCPGGIREVLADGKFGALVPVGDDQLLAKTMGLILTGELIFPDPKEHFQKFDLDSVVDAYLKVLIPD